MTQPQSSRHIPVMRDEVLEHLRATAGGRFLDCTLGGAGHTQALLDSAASTTVVALDRDERAIARAKQRLARYEGRVRLVHAPFSQAGWHGRKGEFDGILADLGVSTDQIFEERGFSFSDAAALDMRMDESSPLTADMVVNRWTESDLTALFRAADLGRHARALAGAMVAARPIADTRTLTAVISGIMARRDRKTKIHPATLVFQAIRMAVNAELEELTALLNELPQLAASRGRVVVICFQSLEDKLVARHMRRWENPQEWSASWAGAQSQGQESKGRLLTRKALKPSAEEIRENPSARSARMRVFEFN